MKNSPGRRAKTREEVAEFIKAGEATRWKAGQSGNVSGRPAVATLSRAIRQVLSESVPGANGTTYAEAIARALAVKAAHGDVRAAAELADRAEGKPTQSIDLAVSQLAQRFDAMSRDELLRYAETGQLPEGMNDEQDQTAR